MIWLIPYCLVVAILHRVRGSDWGRPLVSKYITSSLTGFAAGGLSLWYGYSLMHGACIGLIIIAGVSLGVAFGWGEYFDGSPKPNHEIEFIDKLVSKVCLPGLGADILSMSIRHLFFAPMLIGLSFVSWSFSFLLVPALLVSGPLYFIPGIPEKWRIEAAEIAVGLLVLGSTIIASIYLGIPHAE